MTEEPRQAVVERLAPMIHNYGRDVPINVLRVMLNNRRDRVMIDAYVQENDVVTKDFDHNQYDHSLFDYEASQS